MALYIGRFAPSPTGPLHFGSLVTALASFLQARYFKGKWLLRLEDLDTPRVSPRFNDTIMRTLEKLGLFWDDQVMLQSARTESYQMVLAALQQQRMVYRCCCTRKQITAAGGVYPGHCRTRSIPAATPTAIRLICPVQPILFKDSIQGKVQTHLLEQSGDFVIKRKDGLFAYQLAVVVDDMEQGITQVVRGRDLMHCTAQQIYLFQLLKKTAPNYAHIPLALDANDNKLSKQSFAAPLGDKHHAALLIKALQFLGQNPDSQLNKASPALILEWAVEHWKLHDIPLHNQRSVG